jgi:hypothetical protein
MQPMLDLLVDESILYMSKSFTGEILKDTIENATGNLLGQMIIKLFFINQTRRKTLAFR